MCICGSKGSVMQLVFVGMGRNSDKHFTSDEILWHVYFNIAYPDEKRPIDMRFSEVQKCPVTHKLRRFDIFEIQNSSYDANPIVKGHIG